MNTQYNDPKGTAGALKTPLGLIPPYAMEQTAWVHKLGAEKYGPFNWRDTGLCASTYVNAMLRHLNAWRDGEDLDPESGISHLAHIACNCNILLDAGFCRTLQDDRNKRPDETEEGSPKVGAFELDEELMNDILKWIRGEDEEPSTKHVGGGESYEDFWGPLDEDTVPEYHVLLRDGDKLQDGDEVYVGEDHWLPVYVSDWMTPAIVNGGTYRRKITNCDLKDKVADCDLEDECKCGRRKIYHWLYGYICEDCDTQWQDPY